MENIATAFILSSLAGLSTGIGSIIALFAKNRDMSFLSFSLGLSAGVMIYVSSAELFPEACASLILIYGVKRGLAAAVSAFFVGMALTALINNVIPADITFTGDMSKKKLMKTGLFTALAVAVHNFPEGVSTFMSSFSETTPALPIVIAVAIHNIPEGISVSVPVYYATGSRKKAFLLSFLSGLSEPLGALAAYLVLMPFLSDTLLAIISAAVSGIMLFIALDELLPSAKSYGNRTLTALGAATGAVIMAVSIAVI